MKIYLAGPMRGLELFNFPAFMKAAMSLRDQGHEVINPAERDIALGFNPAEPMDSPANAAVFDLGKAFEWDFNRIKTVDAIVLLQNWRSSKGVQAELVLAMALEKEIYYWSASEDSMVNTVLDEYTVEFGQSEETRKSLVKQMHVSEMGAGDDDSFENIM